MPVTKLFLIGNFTVPSSWFAVGVAFLLAYFAVRFLFVKKLAERFGDAVFYLIIIWKLSVIIFDFKMVVHAPLSVIYFNGGMKGLLLGVAFVAGKMLFDLKKESINAEGVTALFTGTIIAQAIFQVMMVLLNDGSLLVRIITLGVFIGLVFIVWINIRGTWEHGGLLALLFIAAHIFVSAIQPKGLMNTSLFVTVLTGVFFGVIFMRESKKVHTERGSRIE